MVSRAADDSIALPGCLSCASGAHGTCVQASPASLPWPWPLSCALLACASPGPMSCSPAPLMVSSMAAMHRLLGRSCHVFPRCAMTTAEVPQRWYASRTLCTAGKLPVEHVFAFFTRRSDVRRALCTCAESWRVRPPRVVVCDAAEAALDNSGHCTL